MNCRRPQLWLSLAICLLALPLAAQEGDRARVDDQDAISIRGIFDFQLPRILQPEAWRFSVTPIWRDFIDKDSIRFRFGARYAFNEHLEGNVEMLPYIDNVGGTGRGGAGIAEWRFGGKYAWNNLLRPYADTAVGFIVSLPNESAPAELTIGTARFAPYVVFSRDWTQVRGLNTFVNVGCEIFDSNPAPGRVPAYRPSRDNVIITPGVVLHRAPWHYTFATSLRSTVISGETQNYFSILPSVSWEVPPRYVFNAPGRVVAGLGYEAILFDRDVEHRITGRLKWDFDWGKAVRRTTDAMRKTTDAVRSHLPWVGEPAESGTAGPRSTK